MKWFSLECRCIKPNNQNEAENFDQDRVLTQLTYTGVIETTNIRRQVINNVAIKAHHTCYYVGSHIYMLLFAHIGFSKSYNIFWFYGKVRDISRNQL